MAAKRSRRRPKGAGKAKDPRRRRKGPPAGPRRFMRLRLPDGRVSPTWLLPKGEVPPLNFAVTVPDALGSGETLFGTLPGEGSLHLPGCTITMEESEDQVTWSEVDPNRGQVARPVP